MTRILVCVCDLFAAQVMEIHLIVVTFAMMNRCDYLIHEAKGGGEGTCTTERESKGRKGNGEERGK